MKNLSIKISALLLAVTMTVLSIFSGCSSKKDLSPIDKNTSMTASEVAERMGIGLSLGNTMESFSANNCDKTSYEWMPTVGSNTPKEYETFWGAIETTQEIIDGMKAEGFNTLRIPVYWGNMMENDGNWTVNKDYLARVREIVDYGMNAEMFVVVNCHHFDEFIIRRNDTEACKQIFTTLWSQIAEEFKDYPYTLVFEGFNEYLGGAQFDENGVLKDPSWGTAYKLTNTCNQAFVDAVRATGGKNADRVLIVSGYNTNIDRTTDAAFKMPSDSVEDRLMVSVHYVDNAMYWQNSIGNQRWLDYTDSQIELLVNAFSSKGIPVFLGETSAGYPAERFASDAIYKDSSECLDIVLSKLQDKGFVPVIWDICNNFYSRSDCRIADDNNRDVIHKAVNR